MKNPYLLELSFFIKNAYPPFVCQLKPTPIKDYVPVFTSHSVNNKEFEETLIFLKENHYRAITVSELYNFIQGVFIPSSPTVCLTFDDGHKSLYEVAFPLLKKYNLTATAFIVPAFIGKPVWITWQQVEEMSKSGIIEFQSHTLEHKRIFINNKIIAYNHPGLFKNELGLDKPTIVLNGKETKDIPLGFPIYKMDSRMGDKPRYLDNGKWETTNEQYNAVLFDLAQSKKILEERLNKPILHLAYPWGIGGKPAQDLSKKAGFLTNFWGPIYRIPYNKIGSNPYKLVRLKDDYIFRLPGKGRKPLFKIFSEKLNRRKRVKMTGRDIY